MKPRCLDRIRDLCSKLEIGVICVEGQDDPTCIPLLLAVAMSR